MNTPTRQTLLVDEVNLDALILALRSSEARAFEEIERPFHARPDHDGVLHQNRSADKRAHEALRSLAEECIRFDGQTPTQDRRPGHEVRHYSLYAIHPDTADEIIAALKLLRERLGPVVKFPTRSQDHRPTARRSPPPADGS